MKLWDDIYMEWNGELITPQIGMDENDHKVLFFEKRVEEDCDVKPMIIKVLNDEHEIIKTIQELHLKKGDSVKYEFRIHLVAE